LEFKKKNIFAGQNLDFSYFAGHFASWKDTQDIFGKSAVFQDCPSNGSSGYLNIL
jgi:hypothetical protein